MNAMLKDMFSFEGRLRRIHYFLYLLCGGLIFTFAYLIIGVGLGALFGSMTLPIILLIPFFVAYIWFCLAVAVKRLHDLNKSGWYYLICLIPIVNFFWGLYMLFGDGTVGPNNYGPDPKNRVSASQFNGGAPRY